MCRKRLFKLYRKALRKRILRYKEIAVRYLRHVVVANPLIVLVSVWDAVLFMTNNSPSTLFERITDLVVAKHSTLTGIWASGARSRGRSSKTVLVFISKSECSTVEWHTKDQLLRWATTIQPVAYSRVLCKTKKK